MRASQSIPLSIAEGNGKTAHADRQRYFGIARGSARECGAVLDILLRCGAITEEWNTDLGPLRSVGFVYTKDDKGGRFAVHNFQPDVGVLDFLTRFWQYPEGCARDIRRIRSHLGCDVKPPSPLGRALVNAAAACAEGIGVPEEAMRKEMLSLEPHRGSAGRSIASQVRATVGIAQGWMVPGVTKAIGQARRRR